MELAGNVKLFIEKKIIRNSRKEMFFSNNGYQKCLKLTVLIVFCLILGCFSTMEYVKARGLFYIECGNQLARHFDILEGKAGNPWQYRILAPCVLSRVLNVFEQLKFERYVAISFISFRVFQDTLVLFLSFIYFSSFGHNWKMSLTGVTILAWSISYSHYNSDLVFNTFFDVIFYLVAGIAIHQKSFKIIIPLTLLASLNRETSGFIPLLLLTIIFSSSETEQNKARAIQAMIVSLCIYLSVFFGLRFIYGEQQLYIPFGVQPGFALVWYNLTSLATWFEPVKVYGLIPFIALAGFNVWPPKIKFYFWLIVPAWCVVHMFLSVVAETRLFLVPFAMVFIPGFLSSVSFKAND